MTTLLLSSRFSEDNQRLWRAAIRRNWDTERVHGIRVPEIATEEEVVLYVEALYAPTVAGHLGLRLLETSESWLPSLPEEYRLREVRLSSLGAVRNQSFPAFVKPPNDKSFPAKVYQGASELPEYEEESAMVLIAEPVSWEVEFRCFCLEGSVRTVSPYLREGALARLEGYRATDLELRESSQFAGRVINDERVEFPKAAVLDVGYIAGRGWAVVESNGAWGSGIYGCDSDEVLTVLRHAVEAG